MLKKITLKKIVIALIFLLVIFQFFRIDKSTKPIDLKLDFISITNASPEISGILKTSCYDCHSNQPSYPWYTNIAPISWWIKHHINEGSHHLNFSEWESYSLKRKNHKLEECVEMVEEDEMPMTSYTIMHGNAKLNASQKQLLLSWFKSLKDSLNTSIKH
ncbi:MAG: heme-binding domain-containing protein [Bacteroidota bacterium]|nr:heme-binding domain-containing protein [Bacteroidota bacterium]MDP3144308.1 heme-binding domain-containing protein [Bacteroidota bacterium]MDP3556294.1 heme-binding domain-containing protein [Bacteroidota bacterium]